MFSKGVSAADPKAAVIRALMPGLAETVEESAVQALTGSECPIQIIAVGKAAIPMTEGALYSISKDRLKTLPVVVTNYENALSHPNMHILSASHPIPNEDGLLAARIIAATAADTDDDGLILALISGGASSLAPMPSPPISLSDKQEVTRLLLMSGADIHETNTVRKHLSEIKGGGLARLAYPTALRTLILSDVPSDDLSTIASGVTAGDSTTFPEAVSILQQKRIWHHIPASVRAHLEQGCSGLVEETPFPDDPLFNNTFSTIIASNRTSLKAVSDFGKAAGYNVEIVREMLVGEARLAGQEFALNITRPVTCPTAYIAGGETTVTVTGSGSGGRNQELALACALAFQSRSSPNHWVFLSGSTDGIDGPTNAAGGLVDSDTTTRIRVTGYDPSALLANNDSYHALRHANDLLITGPTGTNVADLQILLTYPK